MSSDNKPTTKYEYKRFKVFRPQYNKLKEYLPSPLWAAVMNKDHDVASMLIKSGEDVNEKFAMMIGQPVKRTKGKPFYFAEGTTLLMITAYYTLDLKMAELLLKNGADISATNELRENALHLAVNEDCPVAIAKFLIENGVDPTAKNNKDQTVLHYASRAFNEELVLYILGCGVDIHAKDNEQCNALHRSAMLNKTCVNTARLFIEHGISINSSNLYWNTPLHLAIDNENEKMAQLLLRNGAEVHKGEEKFSALYLALQYGSVDLVEQILKKGADPNEVYDGETLLHDACKVDWYKDHDQKVQRLILYGANINAKNESNQTPLAMILETMGYIVDIEYLVTEIVRLQTLGSYVDSETVRLINDNEKLKEIVDECNEEITHMKADYVYNNVTSFHLLEKPISKIVPLLKNEEFVDSLVKGNYEKIDYKFPLYAPYFIKKYNDANAETKVEVEIENTLSSIFTFLPDAAISRITYYLK